MDGDRNRGGVSLLGLDRLSIDKPVECGAVPYMNRGTLERVRKLETIIVVHSLREEHPASVEVRMLTESLLEGCNIRRVDRLSAGGNQVVERSLVHNLTNLRMPC